MINAWLDTDFNEDEDIILWFMMRKISDAEESRAKHLGADRPKTQKRLGAGRPKKQMMNEANAMLIRRFPVIAERPILLAILEHLEWLDCEETDTSRFPTPETYGLCTVKGTTFADDVYPPGVSSKADAILGAKRRVKTASARARDRVKRAVQVLEDRGVWSSGKPVP